MENAWQTRRENPRWHWAKTQGWKPSMSVEVVLKLEKALQVFDLSVEGATTIDIGASIAGFTDVMLQNGAELSLCSRCWYPISWLGNYVKTHGLSAWNSLIFVMLKRLILSRNRALPVLMWVSFPQSDFACLAPCLGRSRAGGGSG